MAIRRQDGPSAQRPKVGSPAEQAAGKIEQQGQPARQPGRLVDEQLERRTGLGQADLSFDLRTGQAIPGQAVGAFGALLGAKQLDVDPRQLDPIELKGVASPEQLAHALAATPLDLDALGQSTPPLPEGANPVLASQLQQSAARTLVQQYDALGPQAFHAGMQRIYGDRYQPQAMDALVGRLRQGDLGDLPSNIQFVSPAVLGDADAAYAGQDGGTIYLSTGLGTRESALQRIFNEEWLGHGLTSRVAGRSEQSTALGDEGEALARWLGGEPLDRVLQTTAADNDQGAITVEGSRVPVRFHRENMHRRWEAGGGADPGHWNAAAETRLGRRVDDALLGQYRGQTLQGGSAVATLDDLQTYLAEQGKDYQQERQRIEAGLVGEQGREAHLAGESQALARQALAATMLAKLKKGEVLPESTSLDTELPLSVQRRVDADPALRDKQVKSYGDLVGAIVGDADENGQRDVDALTLARYLPGASQQEILKALLPDLPADEVADRLAGVGFTAAVPPEARASLSLKAPASFGLAGRTELDQVQQQLLLRNGMIFVDANKDAKVDDNDRVEYIDSAGQQRETLYKDLSPELKKMVRLNAAITKACRDYAASGSRISFPHYNSSTRESEPEKVNEDFWKVSKVSSECPYPQLHGSTSWELKEGVKPSDALADPLEGNGNKYTTECAHARNIMRLKGLRDYYRNEFGEGEGDFRFNALFAKDRAGKDRAEAYLDQLARYKQDNPDKGWADFVQQQPEPEIAYGLEVSRHITLDGDENILSPWKEASGESAGGTTGYFHNRSVSPVGVKIGYIGENVIDLGYRDGERVYWGHPGGIKAEERWQSELGSGRIPVKQMADYKQYFSPADSQHDVKKWFERFSEMTDMDVARLRERKPAGWEGKVKEKEEQRALFGALADVRVALADGFDETKLDQAKTALKDLGSSFVSSPIELEPLRATASASAQRALAQAFDKLSEDQRKDYARVFGQPDATSLSDEQKGNAALHATLFLGGATMHPTLKEELVQAATTKTVHEWLDGHLASRDKFKEWIASEGFGAWYQEKTGGAYSGEADLAKLTTDDVQKIVELALPIVKHMNTAYGNMSRDVTLGRQMAMLLKEGKLPPADFRGETPIAPRD